MGNAATRVRLPLSSTPARGENKQAVWGGGRQAVRAGGQQAAAGDEWGARQGGASSVGPRQRGASAARQGRGPGSWLGSSASLRRRAGGAGGGAHPRACPPAPGCVCRRTQSGARSRTCGSQSGPPSALQMMEDKRGKRKGEVGAGERRAQARPAAASGGSSGRTASSARRAHRCAAAPRARAACGRSRSRGRACAGRSPPGKGAKGRDRQRGGHM